MKKITSDLEVVFSIDAYMGMFMHILFTLG